MSGCSWRLTELYKGYNGTLLSMLNQGQDKYVRKGSTKVYVQRAGVS